MGRQTFAYDKVSAIMIIWVPQWHKNSKWFIFIWKHVLRVLKHSLGKIKVFRAKQNFIHLKLFLQIFAVWWQCDKTKSIFLFNLIANSLHWALEKPIAPIPVRGFYDWKLKRKYFLVLSHRPVFVNIANCQTPVKVEVD